jgi:hypothetical protein
MRAPRRGVELRTFVIGDIHGQRDTLVGLLRDAGLVDGAGRWSGEGARLWLMGDLTDRGPDGVGVIDLVMRLEQESDGDVRCLLGNHDLLLLAAARHRDAVVGPEGLTFDELWRLNGGNPTDRDRLEPHHLAWIEQLPPVAREGEWLLLHADTDAYLRVGRTPDAVNRAARAALDAGEPGILGALFEVLCERGAFSRRARLDGVLAALGGSRVVHGHTPIAMVLGRNPTEITAPLVYADGRAVNVDHCLFAGGPGFVVELDRVGPATTARRRGPSWLRPRRAR